MVLVSAATRLRHGFGAGCGACPTSAVSVSGLLPVSLYFIARIDFISLSAFCLFCLWSYCVPAYWVPLGGCALRTLDVTSDWVSLAPFLALPGLCGLVDLYSLPQLLRHPALDTVWLLPCLPRSGLLTTPCLGSGSVVLVGALP